MFEQELIWLFIPLLFMVAFLYASVGHGGASGYLALMALFGFSPSIMKPSALILNIFVSFVAFYQYYKGGYFKWKLFLPFAVASIPASFIGAYIVLDTIIYKKILGILLVFPVLRLLGVFGEEKDSTKEVPWHWGLLIGAVIGLLSGMIGIGGGIILSPLILLFHWGNMKQTAAVSALFIFVNSVSGLIGILMKGSEIDPQVYLWLFAALTGGFAGAYMARKKFTNKALKVMLAAVLIIASIKLLTV